MANRTVTVPTKITRVVTAGSIPAINSCLLAMGKGSLIVNGLPDNVKERCKKEFWFAPNIENQIGIAIDNPDIEVILSLKPDIVFTDDEQTLAKLVDSKLTVVCLHYSGADEIRTIITLIGQVFGETDRANKTVQFFDNKINEINAKVASIPTDQRPKVLYGDISTLQAAYITADWCIDKAGGISVAAYEGRVAVFYNFSMEQLVAWNPDIIIVRDSSDISYIYSHSEFSVINAVKNKKVYTTPSCMGQWGGSSPEMPMAVEWLASKFYPATFPEDDMEKDVISFYKEFYGYELTDSQLQEILAGAHTGGG